jgi:hypothetical protein
MRRRAVLLPLALLALTAAATVGAPTAHGAGAARRVRPAPGSFPALPPDGAASGLWWFAPRRPSQATDDGSPPDEPGIWHRDAPEGAWSWVPLAEDALTVCVHTGPGAPPPPAWPEEGGRVRAEQVVGPTGAELGYWVWNAVAFVRLPSGSHRWEPCWVWAPTGRPVLLVPDPDRYPLAPDGPAYTIGLTALPALAPALDSAGRARRALSRRTASTAASSAA